MKHMYPVTLRIAHTFNGFMSCSYMMMVRTGLGLD